MLKMSISPKYLLLFVAIVAAERQIKLEDIERDNILNEQRTNIDKEIKSDEPTQHFQPPPPPLASQSSSSSYEVKTYN